MRNNIFKRERTKKRKDLINQSFLATSINSVCQSLKVFCYKREVQSKHSKGISKKDSESSPAEEKATWQKRKEQYLENLKNDSAEVLLVCCADKIHNLMSVIEAYKKQGKI